MFLEKNPLEPIQVCFLCPHGPSPRIHRVTRRNDCSSWESPNEFPPNVTSLSDRVSTCIIVFPFIFLHIFSKLSLMYCFLSLIHMEQTSDQYMGFTYGASRWTPNLTSTAWVIYSPSHELIHIDRICVGTATNNQAEYDGVNGLLAATL